MNEGPDITRMDLVSKTSNVKKNQDSVSVPYPKSPKAAVTAPNDIEIQDT